MWQRVVAHAEARRVRESCATRLQAMYESKIGDKAAVPRVLKSPEELIWLDLDHRSGFVLAQIDGISSYEDIVEVAGATKRPVELVAEIYFELSTRLGLPWLRETIASLPGEAHWEMLARTAMDDDLSALQRAIAGEVLTGAGDISSRDDLIAAWQERNRRSAERASRLLGELRAAPAADASMLSVALRELRNLAA